MLKSGCRWTATSTSICRYTSTSPPPSKPPKNSNMRPVMVKIMVSQHEPSQNGRATTEKSKPQSQACQDFAAFFRWSECRDSNSRPLGPELVSLWFAWFCACSQCAVYQGFSRHSCGQSSRILVWVCRISYQNRTKIVPKHDSEYALPENLSALHVHENAIACAGDFVLLSAVASAPRPEATQANHVPHPKQKTK